MASRNPNSKPIPPIFLADLFDQRAFDDVRSKDPSLDRLIRDLDALHPAGSVIARDLFLLFFREAPDKNPQAEQSPLTRLGRLIIDAIRRVDDPIHAAFVLDPIRAAIPTRHALELLRRILLDPRLFRPSELVDAQRLAELSQRYELLADALNSDASNGDRPEVADQWRRQAQNEQLTIRRELRKLSREQDSVIADIPTATIQALARSVHDSEREVAEASALMQEHANDLGIDATSGHDRLEDGRALARSDKLRQLARRIGALRNTFRADRRKLRSKGSEEVFGIERSGDVARVLPSEWIGLRHPQLSALVRRGLVEGTLPAYRLRHRERGERGPIIVCVDGSGSMNGEREHWAKAVTIAFSEIARQERRALVAITFSGSEEQLREFELCPVRRHGPSLRHAPRLDLRQAGAFADYQPAGGTDFVAPLERALAHIESGEEFRRADIVFVTDGAAHVPATFVQDLRRRLQDSETQLIAVAVGEDVEPRSLAELADKIVPVADLSDSEGTTLARLVRRS